MFGLVNLNSGIVGTLEDSVSGLIHNADLIQFDLVLYGSMWYRFVVILWYGYNGKNCMYIAYTSLVCLTTKLSLAWSQ